MLTNIMKCVCIVALLGAMMWQPAGGWQLLWQSAVFAGAALVVVQSYRVDKFRWGIVFAVIAIFFNPLTPSLWLSHIVFLWVAATTAALFLASLVLLKARPHLSVAGLRERAPAKPWL